MDVVKLDALGLTSQQGENVVGAPQYGIAEITISTAVAVVTATRY